MLEILLWIIAVCIVQYVSFYAIFILVFKENTLFILQQLEYIIQNYFGEEFMFYIGFALFVLFWEILAFVYIIYMLYYKIKG